MRFDEASRRADTIAANPGYKASEVTRSIELLNEKIKTLGGQIQSYSCEAEELREEFQHLMRHAEMATIIQKELERLVTEYRGYQAEIEVPSAFFVELLQKMDQRMRQFRVLITNIERNLATSSTQRAFTPQTLENAMRFQQQPFLLAASQVAILDETIQDQKAKYLVWRKKYYRDNTDPFQPKKTQAPTSNLFKPQPLAAMTQVQASTQPAAGQPGAAAPTTGFTGFNFGTSATPAAATPGAFSFGTTPTTPAATTGAFSFGTTPAAGTTTPAAGAFSFGTTPATPAATTGAFSFGTPAAGAATPAAPSAFSFGTPAAAPTTPAAPSAFTFASPGSATNPTASAFSFAPAATPATPAAGGAFSFGTPAAPATPAAGFTFGTPAPATPAGGFTFGTPTAF